MALVHGFAARKKARMNDLILQYQSNGQYEL